MYNLHMDPNPDEAPRRRAFEISPPRSNIFSVDKPEREIFQPEYVQVTPSNWEEFFPDIPSSSSDLYSRLESGLVSIIVALDPASGERAGYIQITHDANNQVYIETSPAYERRGVASALMGQAQSRYESLTLYNIAGQVGERLYEKMGFVKGDEQDVYHWSK